MIKNVVVIFLLVFVACSAPTTKKVNPYFEGFVESSIYIHSESATRDSFLYTIFGHHTTTYIKDSFVARVYYDNARVIVGREFLRSDSLKFYQVYSNTDTMYVTDLTNDYFFSNISTKEIEGQRILNKNCIGVQMVNKVQPHLLMDTFTSTSNYYFDTAYRLDPHLNRLVKYGSFDKVFGKYPFLTMKIDQDFEGVQITMTATRVVQNTVSPIYFEVPKNKVSVNPYLR